MSHKYRGYRYKVRIRKRSHSILEYVVFYKGTLGWIVSWVGLDLYIGPDYKRMSDQTEEAFVVGVHKKAQKWIDERADKDEEEAAIRKALRRPNLDFIGKLMKEE